MNNKVQFLQALSRYDDYLICSHTNPDADSIGSMLAMYCYLEELGKNVTMVVPDPIPDWPLPNIDKMRLFQIRSMTILLFWIANLSAPAACYL